MATWVATGIELVVLTHAVRGQRNGWKSASECVRPFPDIERISCQEKMEETGTFSASIVLKSVVFRSTCNDLRMAQYWTELHSFFLAYKN
jgi:hypothetical protein